MLGGRFAGNYIPLRNRQLKKFMGDVDVIRRLQDIGEHSRLVATQASQSTELQQLRAHLGGHIASVPLRNMMLDRVRQLQEEMRSTDDSIERARRVINMVRPGKGLSMQGMPTSPQLEALAEHTLHLAQAAGAGTATPADIAEMRRGHARLTKLFGARTRGSRHSRAENRGGIRREGPQPPANGASRRRHTCGQDFRDLRQRVKP